MAKIKVKQPIVEIDGDEMTRIIWRMITDQLIFPHLDLETRIFDLTHRDRDATDDQVTIAAAEAIKRHNVGVKCATITPTRRASRSSASRRCGGRPTARSATSWAVPCSASRSSAATCRAWCPGWTLPIVIGRHAFGDQYRATDFQYSGRRHAHHDLHAGGRRRAAAVRDLRFPDGGVALGMYNLDGSIRDFARACMNYALQRGYPVYLSTKNTILKVYDGRFKDLFQEVFAAEFKDQFEAKGCATSTA